MMSKGTIDIYSYLHNKILSIHDQEKLLYDSNSTLSEYIFGKNGIEFRNCRMMLAIQNKSQMKHAKKFYPLEDENLSKDLGNYCIYLY